MISYGSLNERALPVIPIIRAKLNTHCQVWVCSSRLLGVETHYIDKRTVPHELPDEVCPWCNPRPRQIRWVGYLCAQWPRTGNVVIVEVTAFAESMCPLLRELPTLRGVLAKLVRHGPRTNGKVTIEVRTDAAPPADLATEWDLRPHLERVWGYAPFLRVRRAEGDGRPEDNGGAF